ncbi:hypothetical protein [Bifidobacterium callimiconis]|uniref:Uncharacterized protein n=1 Tax=Bifidobacterium callimiconis TaxID=2306973 RepID=A0A430FIY4_9BIFI|nr:hypothetical protein [Bifidobacterium callimiconis]RSX52678.1 hypothetical protein D2E23_0406 [Bifidobacterium callimiconis]
MNTHDDLPWRHVRQWPARHHGTRGLWLILITLAEGWCACYAITHSHLTGSPQWAITLSALLTVILPMVWLWLVCEKEEGDVDDAA